MAQDSYIIVGAGVFGVSTAYHLIQKYPEASITLVDRDAFDAQSRVAASWDWNKVVRADYDDLIYCRLALEAQDIFETDDLWKPYFHQTGIFWMCRSDYAQQVIDNYATLGRKADLSAVDIKTAKTLYNGLFEDADYADVKEVLVNKTSGWAAAGDCLRAVTRKCLDLGVKYVVAEVESVLVGNDGVCTGIETTQGRLQADKVILSTGAYTASLLESSAARARRPQLTAGERIVAGGIATGMTTLDDQSYPRFRNMPVAVQGYTAEVGPFIGSLPPTADRELKWWGQKIFRNSQRHEATGRHISAPPAKEQYAQWDVSGPLKEDIDHANHVFYGRKGATWKMEKHRICWDAFTTSGDFIISPHSAASGLFVATCGNFHGWKFFPVLGKYVVQMLEGSMSDDLSAKWAWDRQRPDPALFADFPRHEMRALL